MEANKDDDELKEAKEGKEVSLSSVPTGEYTTFVPKLPTLKSDEGYNEISDENIAHVMDDNPTADEVGSSVSSIRRLRGEFGLIADHEGTVIPERILRHVNKFIDM